MLVFQGSRSPPSIWFLASWLDRRRNGSGPSRHTRRRCHLGSVRSAACEQEKQRAAASAMPRAEQRLRLFDNVETYRENGRHARRFKQRLIEQGGDVFACCVPPPNW